MPEAHHWTPYYSNQPLSWWDFWPNYCLQCSSQSFLILGSSFCVMGTSVLVVPTVHVEQSYSVANAYTNSKRLLLVYYLHIEPLDSLSRVFFLYYTFRAFISCLIASYGRFLVIFRFGNPTWIHSVIVIVTSFSYSVPKLKTRKPNCCSVQALFTNQWCHSVISTDKRVGFHNFKCRRSVEFENDKLVQTVSHDLSSYPFQICFIKNSKILLKFVWFSLRNH